MALRDSNPHSADQKYQSLNSVLLTAPPRHFHYGLHLHYVLYGNTMCKSLLSSVGSEKNRWLTSPCRLSTGTLIPRLQVQLALLNFSLFNPKFNSMRAMQLSWQSVNTVGRRFKSPSKFCLCSTQNSMGDFSTLGGRGGFHKGSRNLGLPFVKSTQETQRVNFYCLKRFTQF